MAVKRKDKTAKPTEKKDIDSILAKVFCCFVFILGIFTLATYQTFNQFKNNIDLEDIKDTDNNKEINNNEMSNINNRINNEVISNNSDGNLINEIHLNKILVHIGFCCIRSRNNLNNILLDESKNLLSEKLDIINIFKMMCLGEEVRDKFKLNNERIQMSNECQTSLENINVK